MKAAIDQALLLPFTVNMSKLELGIFLLLREDSQSDGVAELLREIVSDLDTMANEGKLNPYVSGRYPLKQGAEALRALLDRKVTGKVVIEPHR